MDSRNRERLRTEFGRQVECLVEKGYPRCAGMAPKEFIERLDTLKEGLDGFTTYDVDPEKGRLSFVIVVKSDWVSVENAMALVRVGGKKALVQMFPREPGDLGPIDGIAVPDGMAYLVLDIERGGRYNNVVPHEALSSIKRRKRSPLTIDEGIAILTQYPEFVSRNNCFSLLATRCSGDKRVPALWVTQD